MVTIKKIYTDTPKIISNKSKLINREKHLTTKEDGKKETTIKLGNKLQNGTIRPCLLIITLNINGLNSPTKRYEILQLLG